MKIFITGGTGLVGSRLARRLKERGDHPVVLTRNAAKGRKTLGEGIEIVEGDPMKEGEWMAKLRECDGVIHLAGENIFAQRWNEDFKKQLRESRAQGTQNVVKAMAEGGPKVLVSASAIGWYGPHGDEELTEDSPPADDFFGELCQVWEEKAKEAQKHAIRVSLVRVGIVLDKEGGALKQMMGPFKWGIGGKVGSGKQWMSWIHYEDLLGIILMALDSSSASGPYNGTAPNPVTNKEFTKALGRAIHRPTIFPIPGFALRLRFGEVAKILVTGQRVIPKRVLEQGYQYQFPNIEEALRDILG